ncbi:GntR family transcriptional regulator [Fundicoccus sp. Sow4_F4]|uniref:GntR family transcriptional regulator n=1 Tax=Fundicoccus sp. Sow4_F4 TaxID=3438783 RepID=UPI003F91AF38
MEFDKRIPIYEQLKHLVKQAIVSGEYQPGEVLPSRREMAQRYKVNPNTVQRALKELEEEALIMTGNNVPSQVTDDLKTIEGLRQSMIEAALSVFFKEIEPLKVKPELLVNYVVEYAKNMRGEQDA